MFRRELRICGIGALLCLSFGLPNAGLAAPATPHARVEAALDNVTSLVRPGEDGLASVWDGNKFVQCRPMADRALRCEAAGALMQPSLSHVLVPERLKRLTELGWRLDPSFGAYVQTFPAKAPTSQVADAVLQALAEGYAADLANLEVQSDWIASEPCPPRNGPSQNLAGMINDAHSMAATAVHACAYRPAPGEEPIPLSLSAAQLIDLYGPRVTGELQRLRVNANREVFFALTTGAGYIQCQPQTTPPALYCEAASADSWPVVASVLTPERLARLRAAGFADPGRAPNYSKTYPDDASDSAAIARELLSLLHDVYGYGGSPKLDITSEKSGE